MCIPTIPDFKSLKSSLIEFSSNVLDINPASNIIDLDNPIHLKDLPIYKLGIWVDTWSSMVEPLGFEQALDILFIASCRLDNLLFCSTNHCTYHTWLPEFIETERDIHLLFEGSTCYKDIKPIAMYKGRVVYLGSNPIIKLDSINGIDIRALRLETAKRKKGE